MSKGAGSSRLLARIAAKATFGLSSIAAILFGVAGRIDWPQAWFLISLFSVFVILGGGWFFRRDPDLLEERMTTAANVPRWDRLIVRIYTVLLPVLFVTAALDAGRFEWSQMPAAVQAAGMVGIIAAFAVIWWCTAANHFLSSNARIQGERGHRVVQDGPYRYVRHPMYTSLIVLMIGMALTLGSWLAVVPAALIVVLLIIRTSLEDRMLRTELAGYLEYAQHVPGRLVPGLW